MRTWQRRIRAAGIMGLIWAFAWSGVGALVARLPGVYSDLPLPIMFAPLGFITGVLFSGILAGVARRRRLFRLSLPRFAAWGAVSGAALTGLIVAGAAVRGDPMLGELLLFGPPLVGAGAACAAGALAIARKSGLQMLPAADDGPERERLREASYDADALPPADSVGN